MGLQVSSPIRRYRAWQVRANNTSYLALTDGVVHAIADGVAVSVEGFTDAADPPTTKRSLGSYNDPTYEGDGITMCVRKGDYWKVTGADPVFWLPEQ